MGAVKGTVDGSLEAHKRRQRVNGSEFGRLLRSQQLMGEAVAVLEHQPEDELRGPQLDPNAYLGERRRWPRRER